MDALERIVSGFKRQLTLSRNHAQVELSNPMNPVPDHTTRPETNNGTVNTAYEDGIPMASIEVHGDKWCVFGDQGIFRFEDDSLFFRERNIFGFALME